MSDVHLKPGRTPLFRKDGRLLSNRGLDEIGRDFLDEVIAGMLTDSHLDTLGARRDVDLAYRTTEGERFRVNVYFQMAEPAVVFRHIRTEVPSLESIGLPPVVHQLAGLHRGLVLVTGATGHGKSTTVAAIIRHINETRRCHVITIEDPVEFIHEEQKALISQRQIGEDTMDFATALRAALRQDPDVIQVGEIRDRETVETAMRAAETGHLVLSTLHTTDTKETIARIVNMFPPEQQHSIRHMLASTLRAVVCQRLMRRATGEGRVPAAEILVQTERIRALIADPDRADDLRTAIEEGHNAYGTQTFDQSLLQLTIDGVITREDALEHATRPADMKLKMSGIT